IADVLGGLSLLLALASLRLSLPVLPAAVFAATLFGFLSKETALANCGLVPLAALMLAPSLDERKPARWWRFAGALVGAFAARGVYFVIRHKHFHVDLPTEIVSTHPCFKSPGKGFVAALRNKITHYVGAPNLPVDPFNNPLAEPQATCPQLL